MLISIVVPIYNAEKFLKKSVESVISQSYKNIELLLVDDGSTDRSKDICQRYALIDNRIKIILQINKGPAAARNTGVRQATGDFVFFLDADDFIEKDALKVLVTKYKKYQADIVMSNFNKVEDNEKFIRQKVSFSPDDVSFAGQLKVLSKIDIVDYVRHFLRHPSNHLISYCWARLYKLSVLKKNNITAPEDMRLFEDFVFNLDYLDKVEEVVFVNDSLYNYVLRTSHVSASMAILNAESLIHDMSVFKERTFRFLEKNASFMRKTDIQAEIGHTLVHYAIIFVTRTCRQIDKVNRNRIYTEIDKFIRSAIMQESLKSYVSQKGYSKIVPWLMRLKLVSFIMLVCKYKAFKRYGKPGGD